MLYILSLFSGKWLACSWLSEASMMACSVVNVINCPGLYFWKFSSQSLDQTFGPMITLNLPDVFQAHCELLEKFHSIRKAMEGSAVVCVDSSVAFGERSKLLFLCHPTNWINLSIQYTVEDIHSDQSGVIVIICELIDQQHIKYPQTNSSSMFYLALGPFNNSVVSSNVPLRFLGKLNWRSYMSQLFICKWTQWQKSKGVVIK